MLINTVKYCRDDVAIKRLKYIMRDTDDTIVDRYIEIDGQYTLLYNFRLGNALLLYKKKDSKNWLALYN